MWPFKRKTKRVDLYEPSASQERRYRHYEAATIDRLTNGWIATPAPVDSFLRNELPIIRARSRQQIRDNDYAKRFISLVRSNVVGPVGVTIQAQVTRTNGELDEPANDVLEAGFADWGASECDLFGDLTWLDIERLAITTVGVDGEFVAIEHIGPGFGRYGYQLELMDAEQIDITRNGPTRDGGQVRLGVEYGPDGRKRAYHFRTIDPLTGYYTSGETRVVAADRVIHCFIQEWINQTRGVPWMVPALRRMKMLAGYEDAAVIAARVGASKMGFFTSEDNGPAVFADGETDDGNLISDADPGTFEQLPAGVDFQTFDPAYPHEQFGAFVKACLRGVASGLDISYNTLANDLEGVNFSSIRAGVLEDREIFKGLQEWLIAKLHRRVYRNWVSAAVQQHVLTMGKTPLARPSPDYWPAAYQGRRWAWVDPKKDMDANEAAIRLGLRSRSDVIREQGRNPDDVWREIQREQAKMKTYGIEVNTYAQAKPDAEPETQAG